MSTKVTVNQNKSVRTIGFITAILGIIMLVVGAVAYGMVGSFLKDERITVPADASSFAGKPVAGPFTAFSQADIINVHALAPAKPETLDPAITDAAAFAEELGGKTYAELGELAGEWKAKAAELTGAEATEAQAKADAASAKRATVMNGSFLRASLFTSVVAFGVSALVMGVGVLFALVGWAFIKVSNGPAVVTETARAAGSDL